MTSSSSAQVMGGHKCRSHERRVHAWLTRLLFFDWRCYYSLIVLRCMVGGPCLFKYLSSSSPFFLFRSLVCSFFFLAFFIFFPFIVACVSLAIGFFSPRDIMGFEWKSQNIKRSTIFFKGIIILKLFNRLQYSTSWCLIYLSTKIRYISPECT